MGVARALTVGVARSDTLGVVLYTYCIILSDDLSGTSLTPAKPVCQTGTGHSSRSGGV